MKKYSFGKMKDLCVGFVQGELIYHLILFVSKTVEGSASVINKAVVSTGIHVVYFSFLSCLAASIALLLAAYFLESKKQMPLSRDIILQLFLAGTCGNFASNLLFLYGIQYTSPELATVVSCSIPLQASAIAIAIGVEQLNLYRYDGRAKILGILIACGGTVVMSLYSGPTILKTGMYWYLGASMTMLGGLCAALSINLQAPLLKKYRAPATVMAGGLVTGTILTGITCMLILDTWSIPSKNIILAVFYSGWVGFALNMGLTAWVISKKGLLLVCCYGAVPPVSTMVLSLLFIGISIHLGSVFGAILVVLGVILSGWAEAETNKLAYTSLEDPMLLA